MDDTIRRAAIDMQRPVFFSMVIIIAAYLPLLTLERVERRSSRRWPIRSVSRSLGALLLALTLVPVLSAWVFRRGARTWRNPLLEWVFDRYEGRCGGRSRTRGSSSAQASASWGLALALAGCSGPNSCRSSTRASSGFGRI